MKSKRIGWGLIGSMAAFALLCFFSCKKMGSTYEPYIGSGEKIYAVKPDSLKASPGKGRIGLSWLRNPKVTRAVILWNDGANRYEHKIQGQENDRWENVIIENLSEGSYQFEVYTYDHEGNASINVTTSGIVYGDDYGQFLLNIGVKAAVVSKANAYVDWYEAPDDAVAMELTYTDREGGSRTVRDPIAVKRSVLEDYLANSAIRYRTLHVPGGIAIDTFYSNYEEFIPKSLIEIQLPSPVPVTNLAGDYNLHWAGLDYTFMFNGDYSDYAGTFGTETSKMPLSFTLDFRDPTQFTRLKFWMRPEDMTLYAYCSPEEFELWGTNDLGDDWSKWTKIMDCKVVKPSGSPLGVLTELDRDVAVAGIDFEFPSDLPKYRYLRWKTNKIFEDLAAVQIAELMFWGISEE